MVTGRAQKLPGQPHTHHTHHLIVGDGGRHRLLETIDLGIDCQSERLDCGEGLVLLVALPHQHVGGVEITVVAGGHAVSG